VLCHLMCDTGAPVDVRDNDRSRRRPDLPAVRCANLADVNER
jgi:hypothetical protein